jgi:hypothetical protein
MKTLVATTLVLLIASSALARESSEIISVLGRPVMEAHASRADAGPAPAPWNNATIDLRLTALIDIKGRQLGEKAASMMRAATDLTESKANAFAESIATALGDLPAGSSATVRCAPEAPLTIRANGKILSENDSETIRAFCAAWFSSQGSAALRKDLGLK